MGALLDAHLALAVAQGRAAWPDVLVDEPAFTAELAARLPAGAEVDTLAKLHVGYLYLCHACAAGDAHALAVFDQRFLRPLAPVLARSGARDEQIADVLQRLRAQLFAGAAPGIVGYGGRGDLRGWLRVTAVRELVRLRVSDDKHQPLDPAALARIAASDSDPELDYLKRAYGNEFSRAFADALAALDDKQRAVLRHQIVGQRSIDEIGALYQVHRATAARWLVEIRAALAGETRKLLAARLRVGTTDLDSIMRLIASQMEVSMGGMLSGS